MRVNEVSHGHDDDAMRLQEELLRLKEALNVSQEHVKSLHETRDQLAAAFEIITDAVVIVDQGGKIVFFNRTAEELFQYESQEIAGQPVVVLIGEGAGGKRLSGIEEFLAGELGRCGHFTKRSERICRRKDGSFFKAEITVSAREDHGKRFMVISITDIAGQKVLKEESIKIKNLDSIGTLAGGIAHDFNNLLMAVTGYISLAKNRVHPEDKVYEFLSEAERISFTGKDLTRQLITFSKGGEPSKTAVNLAHLIKDAADAALAGSAIKCKYLVADNLPIVRADGSQIAQAISNIIINAKEAMFRRGTLVIRAGKTSVKPGGRIPLSQGDYVQVSIEDKGAGIPEQHVSKIFDPYFSTKDMGGQRGVGLGLTVVYSILKKHNGWVGVDSVPGIGSTFHVFLPVDDGSDNSVLMAECEPRGRKKVLFMDDEKVIRDIARQIIEGIGYEPVLAQHGIEAIDLYKREIEKGGKFEAVIFDLTIKGGMGGKDTLKELIYIDPDIKAIVSSGYTDDPVIARYRDYGFIGAITKPYRAKELKELLERVIATGE